MLKQLIYSVGLFAVLLLLVSSERPEKPLRYFNSLASYEGLELSHQPGIYSDSIVVEIKTPGEAKVELITDNHFFTVDGKVTIKEPSVLRISYVDNGGKQRNFIGNYIVDRDHQLPVVAVVVDTNDFFAPDGIYVGHMESNPEGGDPLTIGRAWEKQPITAYAQVFMNNELKDELELDLKTYGGMTLGWKEKSLQLSARKKEHGRKKINVKAFRQLPFREYQHLVLRTSGNDQNKTRIKDMSLSMVADDIQVNTKASRPVVLYINGKYWGIHNLREKVNGDYFRYRYDWKKGSFWELQGSGLYDPTFKSLINYVRAHYEDEDFHQRISDSVDVENFFNYNIIETYINNTDYRGNIRFFKPQGGKWKWLFYDVDLSCDHSYLNRNFIKDRTFPEEELWYNPPYATALLHHMLLNQKFRERFVRQYNYLMATKLRTENFMEKIDLNIEVITPELERHFTRRDNLYRENMSKWNSEVKLLRSFLKKRPPSALRHIQQTFELGPSKHLKVTQTYPHFEGLTMNGSVVHTNEIDGQFFTDYGIDVEVVESDHLYRFVKWSDDTTDRKRSLNLAAESTELKAIFEHIDTSSVQELKLRKYYVNNEKKEALLFVSILNPTYDTIPMKGMKLYEDETGNELALDDITIHPGEEVVFTNNSELFRLKNPDNVLKVVNFMEGMTFVNKVKFALVDNEGWIDSLQVEISDSLLINDPGYLVEKDSTGMKIGAVNIKKLKGMKFGVVLKERRIEKEEEDKFLWWWVLAGGLLLTTVGGVLMFRKKKIGRDLSVILLLLGFSSVSIAQKDSTEASNNPFKDTTVVTEGTKRTMADQFGLSSIEKRVIDNKGRGDDRFYGTRNFRVVLYDLVYRGGGNNLHLRDTIPKYYLWNPMPAWGLKQLSEVGFDKAVYLYSYNFEYWYPESRLDSLENAGFDYICRPKLDDYLDEYLQDVMDRANDTTKGMMYIHCWNGWHQSGLLSAYTLMQFCDYSNAEALKYWETCTDGNYNGFVKVKSRIKSYKPSDKYFFTEEQQKRYCPCEKDVSGPALIQSEEDKINLSADEMMEKGSTASSKNYTYHTIRSGESLGSIASKYGMGVSELQRLNGMTGTTIYAGKKLKVIDHKGGSQSSVKQTTSSSGKIHRVESGESLYSIAHKYHVTVEGIKKANGMKDNMIHPGDKLKIP